MRGMGDMRQLMQQAQRLQSELAERQQKIAELRVEASSGGGMVRAVVTGNGELLELSLAPEVVDPGDVEMLQDMILAAVREAQTQAKEQASAMMADLTGGLPPGLVP